VISWFQAFAFKWVNLCRYALVPFILKAGKGLNEKRSEIRIQLRPTPGDIFGGDGEGGDHGAG
jgi:glucose-6-phosphate 1-dehydrogenase